MPSTIVIKQFIALLSSKEAWITNLGVVNRDYLINHQHWSPIPNDYFYGYYRFTCARKKTQSLLKYSSEGVFELVSECVNGSVTLWYIERTFNKPPLSAVSATQEHLDTFLNTPIHEKLH